MSNMLKTLPEDIITSQAALKDIRTRPKGRQEVVKSVLSMVGCIPEATVQELRKVFPQVTNQMTVEEIMTLMVVNRVIKYGDTAAYTALMDSAYGKNTQPISVDNKNVSSLKLPQYIDAQEANIIE